MKWSKTTIAPAAQKSISERFDSGRLSHAVLLTGGSADERKKTALHLAAAMMCSGGGEKPCGKCPACVKNKAGVHPDLTVISGTDKSKSIKIEDVRELRAKAFIVPNEAEVNVFVILEASGMDSVPQNAMLKIIEEPPAFSRFIFACASSESLLETIRSRVTRFSLHGSEAERITEKTGKSIDAVVSGIVKALVSKNEFELIAAMAPMEKDRQFVRRTADKLKLVLRDALRDNGEYLSSLEDSAVSANLAFSAAELLRMYSVADSVIENVITNANENLLLSIFSSELFNCCE